MFSVGELMQKDLPKRKKIRLQNYDYSSAGAYFITICTKDMRKIFGVVENVPLSSAIVGANCVRPMLSKIGMVAEKEIHTLSNVYGSVKVDKYVIMPNHIHFLISIIYDDNDGGRTKFAPTISRVMKQFKGSITKQIGMPIWQRSFYDHIIRDEDDYLTIWRYIDENPIRCADDCDYIK